MKTSSAVTSPCSGSCFGSVGGRSARSGRGTSPMIPGLVSASGQIHKSHGRFGAASPLTGSRTGTKKMCGRSWHISACCRRSSTKSRRAGLPPQTTAPSSRSGLRRVLCQDADEHIGYLVSASSTACVIPCGRSMGRRPHRINRTRWKPPSRAAPSTGRLSLTSSR